jgi:hypothetical protein
MKISKTLIAAALSVASVGAFADTTVYGNTFAAGAHTQTTVLGVFEAFVGASNGTFGFKSAQGGYQGVGVSARDPGEIDIGESIVATFGQAIGLTQFTVGLLFNGPEYNDVQEQAQFTVNFEDNTTGVYVLTALGNTAASWSGVGGIVQNLSPAQDGLGGVWSVLNPFGTRKVSSISFAPIFGLVGEGSGTNQSDFTLVSVTAVPEVESYAMMLAGLGLMGTIARRRNKAKAA